MKHSSRKRHTNDSHKVHLHTLALIFMAFTVPKVNVDGIKLIFSYICIRAPQFKKVSLGSEVGSKTDQNKPFRLGLRSFASKLMDRDSIKVFAFGGNQ